jgi:acetylornithine deacetylase
MNALETRVLDAVDLDGVLGLLADLVAFRSEGGRETPVQLRMADELRSVGMEVDEWSIDMDELRRHPAYSAEIDRSAPVGVVGTFGSGDSPVLVLNGHTDVVPAGDPDRWTTDPFAADVREARVYGRGTCDMKGGLACAVAAIRAIAAAGIELAGTVKLQSVVGEEDGGMGTLASILRGHTGDAAVIMEPTELMVAPAQGGALGFRITMPGRAAHGALRTEGVSPFDRYLPVYEAIRAFETRRNDAVDDPLFAAFDIPFPVCIGRIESGIWPSTEAESLVAEGRLGVGTHEEPDHVRAAFERVVRTATERDGRLPGHPPRVEWWGAQFLPAKTPADAPVVGTLRAAHRDASGSEAVLQGMTYGADMRLFIHEAGMPTVMYGPGDIRRAHAPDEYVPVADLETCARTLVLTILRFCGTK